jgi:thiol-disulfide isomerase/thioredoxin
MKSYRQKSHTPYLFLLWLLALMIPISVSAANVFATPKQAKLLIGSTHKQVNAYIIDGHTYLKLRDMAGLFSDTEKCFDVGWDDQTRAIILTSGQPYPHHLEDTHDSAARRQAVPSKNSVSLDGKSIQAPAYLINDVSYFKFTDLAKALGVSYQYDQTADTIRVSLDDQKKGAAAYTPKNYGFGQIGVFKTTDMQGNPVDESVFQKKAVTFINYWATWCPPCRDELPEFQALYDQYKDRVTFLSSVDDGEDNATADKMAEDYLSSFINLLPDNALLKAVRSGYVPTSVIVNEKGYLMMEQIIGSNSMEGYAQYLDQALKLVEG